MLRPLLCAVVLVAGSGAGGAETLVCDNPLVTVDAPDATLAMRGCEAAALAHATLGACDIALRRPVAVAIRDELSVPNCLGVYHCGEDRIEVLTPAGLDAALGDGPFTSVDRRSFWESLIVHELSHAVYDRLACPFESCVGTAEYFAYATQIRALPETDRRIFQAAAGVEGKVSHGDLSGILAMMAPDRFAGLAWAHLSQRPDMCRYLRLILQGAIHFDSERP